MTSEIELAWQDTLPLDLQKTKPEYHALRDGRKLAYTRFGQVGGFPVYYFHGCPGSRLEASPCHPWATKAGCEVFALDRPGCGGSSYAPGYRMLDWPADVAAFADSMAHAQFGIIGFSGGGAYVDACAYAIPDRLLFAYDLAGWAPVAQIEALQDALAPLDNFFLKRASALGFLFRLPFAFIGIAARYLNARTFARLLHSSMGADDRELISDNAHVRHLLRATVKTSFVQGSRGPADDAIRCYRDWGFALDDITYPLQIWHGTDDKFASFSFAKYKHAVLQNSSLRVFAGRGHLHLATVYQHIFADIIERPDVRNGRLAPPRG